MKNGAILKKKIRKRVEKLNVNGGKSKQLYRHGKKGSRNDDNVRQKYRDRRDTQTMKKWIRKD